MILSLMLMAAEVTDPKILGQLNDPKNPYAKYAPKNAFDDLIPREKMGPEPHTLVISDGTSMTRMDYKTGPLCAKARDVIRRQVASPPNTPGVIYGAPRTKAFCVPR